MSSAVTEAATWETSVIGPDGTDLISAAGVRTGLQDVANRTKWLKEGFFDVKTDQATASDSDISSGAGFATGGSLTFTTVGIGDKLIMLAVSTWECATFTQDGTDPKVEARWYIGGATDISLVAGGYPTIHWGVTIGATGVDRRGLTVLGNYTAAASAGTLTAAWQPRVTGPNTMVLNHYELVGLHIRFGA